MSDTSRSSGNGHREAPGFGERVDQIGTDAQRLWSDTRAAAEDIGQTVDLRGRLERHPYGTLAVAFGVGYLLGGGLFTSATARVVRLGVRLAALPIVKDELLHLAESMVDNLTGEAGRRMAEAPRGADGHEVPPVA